MLGEEKIPDFSPHPFTQWFLVIVFGVPFVVLLIWSIKNSEKSYLFGKRWLFKGEPHISKVGIFWLRITNTILLIITLLFFMNWLISFFKN